MEDGVRQVAQQKVHSQMSRRRKQHLPPRVTPHLSLSGRDHILQHQLLIPRSNQRKWIVKTMRT
jgi:hypothetical protein